MEFAIENSIIGKIMKRGKSLRDEKETKIQYQKKSSIFIQMNLEQEAEFSVFSQSFY